MNARNREMTGVSDYVCTSTFCVRHSNSERDWTLLQRSIRALFRVCSCVYINFSFRMVPLWNLIHKYHKDEFPNLITLASLALTAPIHTADCGRRFSLQNSQDIRPKQTSFRKS